ncbi:MAG TPA: hypothetical protein VK785_05125 [Opitutaceae bacterium]|nr:hypothetical protein [Opitutaceae bacterium]
MSHPYVKRKIKHIFTSIVVLTILVSCKSTPPIEAPAWQTTVRSELAREEKRGIFLLPLTLDAGSGMFCVPAPMAKIFETVPESELVPFLTRIQAEKKDQQSGALSDYIGFCLFAIHEKQKGFPAQFTFPDGSKEEFMEFSIPFDFHSGNFKT